MPEPALSEVPVQRARPLAGSASPGTAAGSLCACGVHATLPTGTAGFAVQKRDLRTVVSAQGRDSANGGSRRETPRSRHRLLSVLHTWNQKLLHHPHVHCVVPAGGLSPD